MQQLIYTSEATSELGSGEVFSIVEKSANNNARCELTGFLLYSNGRFLQILEGPEDALDHVMRKIELDPRHQSIRVIQRSAIPERVFPKWAMKRIVAAQSYDSLLESNPAFRASPARIRSAVERFLGIGAISQPS